MSSDGSFPWTDEKRSVKSFICVIGNRADKVLGFEPLEPYTERVVKEMDKVEIIAGKFKLLDLITSALKTCNIKDNVIKDSFQTIKDGR